MKMVKNDLTLDTLLLIVVTFLDLSFRVSGALPSVIQKYTDFLNRLQ